MRICFFWMMVFLVSASAAVASDLEEGAQKMLQTESSSVSAERVIDLDAILKGDQKSLEREIADFVERWKKAWERSAGHTGAIDSYISFYSETAFTDRSFFAGQIASGEFDRGVWKEIKQERNRRKSWIKINLTDTKISCSPISKYATVQFVQEYISSDFIDTTFKTLVLQREEAGWKIVAENTL